MERIMQLGLGFWASKTLLTAIELGLFTELAKGPADGESLRTRLGIHPRAARDFFDTLLAPGPGFLRPLSRAGHVGAGQRPLSQHCRCGYVSRPEQAVLRRRPAGDGQ